MVRGERFRGRTFTDDFQLEVEHLGTIISAGYLARTKRPVLPRVLLLELGEGGVN